MNSYNAMSKTPNGNNDNQKFREYVNSKSESKLQYTPNKNSLVHNVVNQPAGDFHNPYKHEGNKAGEVAVIMSTERSIQGNTNKSTSLNLRSKHMP